jgi:hypothetical protein
VKIGKADAVENRRAALQTGSPHKLEVWLAVQAPATLERELQDQFKEYRIRGEWFDFGDRNPVAAVCSALASAVGAKDFPEVPPPSASALRTWLTTPGRNFDPDRELVREVVSEEAVAITAAVRMGQERWIKQAADSAYIFGRLVGAGWLDGRYARAVIEYAAHDGGLKLPDANFFRIVQRAYDEGVRLHLRVVDGIVGRLTSPGEGLHLGVRRIGEEPCALCGSACVTASFPGFGYGSAKGEPVCDECSCSDRPDRVEALKALRAHVETFRRLEEDSDRLDGAWGFIDAIAFGAGVIGESIKW